MDYDYGRNCLDSRELPVTIKRLSLVRETGESASLMQLVWASGQGSIGDRLANAEEGGDRPHGRRDVDRWEAGRVGRSVKVIA
jgi:hypothetical protein